MHNQGYEVTIDGVSSSTIPEFLCERVNRQLIGDIRHQFETVPGREGAWLFAERPGMKEITIVSHIIADSYPIERRDSARAVANWVDKSSLVKLIIADEPDVFNRAILASAPDINEWRELGHFDLVFTAEPYSYASAISEHVEVSGGASKTFSVTVDGEVFTRPVIEIVGTGAPGVTTVTVSGQTPVLHSTTVGAGVMRTFNSIGHFVEVNANTDTELVGLYDPTKLSMATVTGSFPYLNPGVNSITINVVGATGWTATINWRDRYR